MASGERTTQPWKSYRHTSIVKLKSINDDILFNMENFKLANMCVRLCYFDGKLWCPCCNDDGNGRIDVYDLEEMELCKTINVKDCHNIKSIHPLSNGEQFIMAAKNGLFIANTNGENPQDILSGEFVDVHANSKHIVALQENDDKSHSDIVHIFSHTSPPKLQKSFELGSMYSHRVMLVGEEEIYISFDKDCDDSYTAIYNLNGEKLSQHGKYGILEPGETNASFVCACDNEGAVLIADIDNHRLQVLSKEKEWSVIYKVEETPIDIIFTGPDAEGDKHMCVLLYNDGDDHTLFKFLVDDEGKMKAFRNSDEYDD